MQSYYVCDCTINILIMCCFNLEVLSLLEVTPDVPIIMLHSEDTMLLPRSVLSVSTNHFYCTANWNIVEGKDILVIIYDISLFILYTLARHQPTCLFDLSSTNNSETYCL